MVTWCEVAINVGLVLGFATGCFLSGVDNALEWRVMLGLGAILPAVMIVLVLGNVMPESPRWLILNHRTLDAKMVLQQIYPHPPKKQSATSTQSEQDNATTRGSNKAETKGRNDEQNDKAQPSQTTLAHTHSSDRRSPPRLVRSFSVTYSDDHIDKIVEDIQQSLQLEKEARRHDVGSWGGLLIRPTRAARRMLGVGVGVAVAQQLVGMEAIQYYLVDVIIEAGVESQPVENGLLLLLGTIKLCCVIVSGKLVDTRGRRPLLLVSLAGITAALVLVSLSFWLSEVGVRTDAVAILGLSLYLIFYSVGVGPVGWLIPSEVFSTCIRARAMSLATFANRFTATVLSSTFLSLADGLGWSSFFLLWAAVCAAIGGAVYFGVPETKGRSLEDMSKHFSEMTNDTSIIEGEQRIQEKLDHYLEQRRRQFQQEYEIPTIDCNTGRYICVV